MRDLLSKARDLHRQGRVRDAEKIYLELLAKNPGHVEVLGLLGAIALQSDRPEAAEKHFATALAKNPASPVLHSNRGLALRALGRRDDALACFDQALKLKSDYAPAAFNRALVLQDLARLPEALAAYDRAIALLPTSADAHGNRALVLRLMGNLDAALAAADRAVALQPRHADAHVNRGAVLRDMGRLDDALACFDKAVALKPDSALAHYNGGIVLQDLGRHEAALRSYDKAIALKPDYVEALNNRGLAQRDLRRNEDALADFDRALALAPDYAEAHNNRGAVLQECHRDEEALASFARVLTLSDENIQALNNRAHALRGLGRFDEALASYDRAAALDPGYAEAQFNAGLCRLLLGQFERGWQQYEWRWHGKPRREFKQPAWLGDGAIAGKTILLHAEQGFGDTIQIVRYVPKVADLGANIVLEVQPPLRALMEQFARPGITVTTKGDPLPPFDVHCPLMSLPLAFKTTLATIPTPSAPYLAADPARVAAWGGVLGEKQRLRVGLVWSGSGEYINDFNRSIRLSDVAELLAHDAEFVSLQKEVREHDAALLAATPAIRHFGDRLTSFAETAALAQSMDLVISVDTAAAHLSAALGRPTWILLKREPDWRWLLEREDSVWYPSARLFRQTIGGDWRPVVNALCQHFARWARSAP